MTSGQRKMHVVLWLVVGPTALVGLWLAVLWRPIEPIQDSALPGVEVREGEAEAGGGR